MKNAKDLVDLAHAHATQLTNKGQKGPWRICKNKSNDLLMELKESYNEKQVFEILDFARKFELIAFNAGADFERKKWKTTVANYERQFKKEKELMRVENERLAEILEKHIGEGE